MLIELAGRPRDETYHLLTQVIVPRPIAWVLSVGEQGGHNLAPYSFFNAVSAEPPLVAFSVGRSPRADAPVKATSAGLALQQRGRARRGRLASAHQPHPCRVGRCCRGRNGSEGEGRGGSIITQAEWGPRVMT